VLVWIAGVAALITLWARSGAAAQNDFTGSDSGQTLLNQHFARQSGTRWTLAIESRQKITDPGVKARIARALAPFANAPHVTGVAGPYTTPGYLPALFGLIGTRLARTLRLNTFLTGKVSV
jgi:hypothetical protein